VSTAAHFEARCLAAHSRSCHQTPRAARLSSHHTKQHCPPSQPLRLTFRPHRTPALSPTMPQHALALPYQNFWRPSTNQPSHHPCHEQPAAAVAAVAGRQATRRGGGHAGRRLPVLLHHPGLPGCLRCVSHRCTDLWQRKCRLQGAMQSSVSPAHTPTHTTHSSFFFPCLPSFQNKASWRASSTASRAAPP